MNNTKTTIYFSSTARNKILEGIQLLCDSVKVTLGPNGRVVMLYAKNSEPKMTKDGVSVAEAICAADSIFGCPLKDAGAKLVYDAAKKTAEETGDGTTTATILATEIAKEAIKCLAHGVPAIDIKRGIDNAAAAILADLANQAIKCESNQAIQNVATISANGDQLIGQLILDAINKVGPTGSIAVTNGQSFSHQLEVTDGMELDSGYLSPFFLAPTDGQTIELENAYILAVNKNITNIQELVPILEQVSKTGRPLLIVADGVEGDALNALILNKIRGTLKSVAIKTPGFGEEKMNILTDICCLTSATTVSDEAAVALSAINLDSLGQAKIVRIKKDKSVIIGGTINEELLNSTTKGLREQLSEATGYFKEKIVERLGRLQDGIAVIKVGARTELEQNEIKGRIDDALNAAKAAISKGILPGGGVALLRSASKLTVPTNVSAGERLGYNAVKNAASAPIRQLLLNCNCDPGVIISNILAQQHYYYGYNAATQSYGNLIEQGVVDPLSATQNALTYASSICGLIALTQVAVCTEEVV